MKRVFFAVFAVLAAALTAPVHGQYITKVKVTSLNNPALTEKIETSLSQLLTELNGACTGNRKPKLSKEWLTDDARKEVERLWANSPFRCSETELTESGIRSGASYQVRNIPVIMSRAAAPDNYVELAVSFGSGGVIEAVRKSLPEHTYRQLLKSSDPVTDLRRRQVIIDFLENFRTAYGRKDMAFLQQVYSDNALIITGRIRPKPQKTDVSYGNLIQSDVELIKQNKKEYLAGLQRVFKNNSYIYLNFDEIVITQDGRPNVYGVELKQDWHSDNYKDSGYLFLMVHFNENDPNVEQDVIIDVRTWTPEKRFGLDNFNGLSEEKNNR